MLILNQLPRKPDLVGFPCHYLMGFFPHNSVLYTVVPKGLLTFLGSLYKEVLKTTLATLVYCFQRQTARKKISSFQKQCPKLRM